MNLLPRTRAAAVAALTVLTVALPTAASTVALAGPANAATSCAAEAQTVTSKRQTVTEKKELFFQANQDLAQLKRDWFADRTADNKAAVEQGRKDASEARDVVKTSKDELTTAVVYYRGCASPSVVSGTSVQNPDDRGSTSVVHIRVTNLTPGQVVTVYVTQHATNGQTYPQGSFDLTAGANGVAEGYRPAYNPFAYNRCGAAFGHTLSITINKGSFEGYVPTLC